MKQINDFERSATPTDRPTPEVPSSEVASFLGLISQTWNFIPRWKVFRVQLDAAMYAPVLEFAHDETTFPTTTDIWQELTWSAVSISPSLRDRSATSTQARTLLDMYLRFSKKEIEAHAAVYYRYHKYSGSWLFEYWTYYPFDTGHVANHPHDTEHLFVEAEMLGGRVLGVYAASHSSMTPNNLYVARQPDAEPASLPIFAMVEKGKHALAPDINHDGKFTPGIDVDVGTENSQVWGVRDAIGQTDSHMRGYEAAMTLDRVSADAWATKMFTYSDGSPFAKLRRVYDLVRFPAKSGTSHKDDQFSPERANELLNDHADALHPENIFKPWVFPFRMIRVGWETYNGLLTLGFVSDLRHIKLLSSLRLPGRIEFVVKGQRVPEYANEQGYIFASGTRILTNTGRILRYDDVPLVYGIEYERATSNLFGYFAAYFRRHDFSGRPSLGCNYCALPGNIIPLPNQPLLNTPTTVGQFGVFVEVPHVRNLTVFAGPVFTWPVTTSGVFGRVAFSVWRSRGRHQFGLK